MDATYLLDDDQLQRAQLYVTRARTSTCACRYSDALAEAELLIAVSGYPHEAPVDPRTGRVVERISPQMLRTWALGLADLAAAFGDHSDAPASPTPYRFRAEVTPP